jgi:hypothetical protein
VIGIIKRKALIKELAAAYHAECLVYCQELLELQRKWEEVRNNVLLFQSCIFMFDNLGMFICSHQKEFLFNNLVENHLLKLLIGLLACFLGGSVHVLTLASYLYRIL